MRFSKLWNAGKQLPQLIGHSNSLEFILGPYTCRISPQFDWTLCRDNLLRYHTVVRSWTWTSQSADFPAHTVSIVPATKWVGYYITKITSSKYCPKMFMKDHPLFTLVNPHSGHQLFVLLCSSPFRHESAYAAATAGHSQTARTTLVTRRKRSVTSWIPCWLDLIDHMHPPSHRRQV